MKTRILNKETITPLEPYLSSHRKQQSYDAQVAFAVILIGRERDYYQLNREERNKELKPDGWVVCPRRSGENIKKDFAEQLK